MLPGGRVGTGTDPRASRPRHLRLVIGAVFADMGPHLALAVGVIGHSIVTHDMMATGNGTFGGDPKRQLWNIVKP